MRNLVIATAALVGLIALAAPAAAGVIRVPADFGTIQAAVDAAGTGDKIVIDPGTYLELVTVTGKTDLLIRGRGTVVIANPSPSIATMGLIDSPRVRLKKVNITNSTAIGLVVSNCVDGLISKCNTQGAVGIAVTNSDGIVLSRCRANATSTAIFFTGSGVQTADRCKVTPDVTARGFFADSADNVTLTRCKATYAGLPVDPPIEMNVNVRAAVDRCKVLSAKAAGGVAGIEFNPTAPSTVTLATRNLVDGPAYGIGALSANVTCTRNTIVDPALGGLVFFGQTMLIEGNVVRMTTPAARGITLLAMGAQVRGNKLIGGGTGVLLNGQTCTIEGNKFKNLQFGISLVGDANTCGPKNKYVNCITKIDDGGTNTVILD